MYAANDQAVHLVFGEHVNFDTAIAGVGLLIFAQKIQDPISESGGDPGHSKCILMSQHFPQPQQLAQPAK
jgi:hypothetical protein